MEAPGIDAGLLRLLDAAGNRVREGLRVIEDIARFVWDDPQLVEEAKGLRHATTSALQSIEKRTGPLIAARDTPGDVGTTLTTAGETTRADVASLLRANAARVQEGLRTLEEAVKLIDPTTPSPFKSMRYSAYTLEVAALQRQGLVVPLTTEALDG